MAKSNVKTKKVQRATEATPKDAAPSAEKSSPKKATPSGLTEPPRRIASHTRGKFTDEGAGACYRDRSKRQADATNRVSQAQGDYTADSSVQRVIKPSEGEPASANTTASELPPPPTEDGPDPVDYEESEPDQERELGEVPDRNSSRQLTKQQRLTHPGSPTIPKTAAAAAHAEAQAQGESHRDTVPTDMPEQPIITNTGIDEGVPPEQLQPDNRRHLSERTQQEASQAVGTKREREASTPRTREQLLALRYWTLNEYREHLRLSRRPGPRVSQCDKYPVVLWDETELTRQTNEREFEVWLRILDYACPEFLASPYRIDLAGTATSTL
ncbi:unnamed protein product [Phytophthora fragariaefolia]|uniref:Unnamed protein product n=1 Tax=Phytophthora fragariaefolia TaxID=1490495 RepID=A0A9W6YMC4_9STRA|nr:unnamed protein product [Phytophthora fragariaefolia]